MSEEVDDDAERLPVIKASIFGRDGSEESRVIETDKVTHNLFTSNNVIEPPYDPATLAFLYEVSGALRTNIDAYITNIDSFGHVLKEAVDLDDEETVERIREAIIQERIIGIEVATTPQQKAIAILKRNAPNLGADKKPTGYDDSELAAYSEPTDAEVEARIASVKREMVREKMRLEQFFDFCCVDESFVSMRMKVRQDFEMLGNGYVEALRNRNGDLVQFTYVPGYTMRLLPQDAQSQEVPMTVRATLITETTEIVRKRFRRFIQVVQNGSSRQMTFFKEFGDPRCVSSSTGRVYVDEAAMLAEEPASTSATEILHFKVHSARTPYGVPRWISELLSVLGSRHADEINLAYFENKSIPPMVITVSGGRMSKDTVKKIEDYIKNDVRGKKNYHKIMIIEAESPGIAGASAGAVKIDIKPLTDAQNNDALFMKYREANVLSIGSVFRLPKLLRGDSADQNRATAQAALEFAEQQVFCPLRNEFDFVVNRRILTDLGVRFWKFESKGPVFSDPNELLTAVNEAAKSGYMTPNELREVAARGLDIELPKIDEEWASERPMQLTLAAMTAGKAGITGEEEIPPPPPALPGMPGAPGAAGGKAPPFGKKPGAVAPGKPGAPKAPKPPAAEEKPTEKVLEFESMSEPLEIPSPHDMAIAAERLARFSKYTDAKMFFESHDEENDDSV